ncbi:unnamed protein product [Penicillium bialowiezense]
MPSLSKVADPPLETDIDRTKCTRVVPMRVLCLGLSRTGTSYTLEGMFADHFSALRAALQILGYDQTYHGYAAHFENPRDCIMWLQAFGAKFDGIGTPFGREEFDQLLGHCQAVTDIPAACFAEELIHAYPEAKVVLTHRDIDTWYDSMMKAIFTLVNNPWSIYMTPFLIFFRGPIRWSRLLALRIWDDYFRGFGVNGRQVYKEHYELVESLVPKDNLLYYQVKEGWEPLCRFLGQPVPDVPFPRGIEIAEVVSTMNADVRAEAIKAGWNFLYAVAFLGVVLAMVVGGIRAM